MALASSQYLQVPKLQYRRPKSQRSRQRPRGEQPECVSATLAVRSRLPPMYATDYDRIPKSNSFSSHHVITEEVHSREAWDFRSTVKTKAMMDIHTKGSDGTIDDDLSMDFIGTAYSLDRSLTPPPATPLRQKLIGTWKLESYIAYPTPMSTIQRPTFPMTRNVTGFIMYTPDGYMSAQMLIPGQQTFKRGEGEDAQWTEAAKRFFGYSGPYYISDEGRGREEVLRHTFQFCNLPGWVGDIQIRTHRFEDNGEVLVLGSEVPTEIKGDKRRPELKWRRARDNVDGVPPPPTPQIKISGPGEP